jgi:hypothetical protein
VGAGCAAAGRHRSTCAQLLSIAHPSTLDSFTFPSQPCLTLLRQSSPPLLPPPPHSPTDTALVAATLKLFDGAVSQVVTAGKTGATYSIGALRGLKGKAYPALADLEAMATWAVVWGLGGMLSPADRAVFCAFVNGIVSQPASFVEDHPMYQQMLSTGERACANSARLSRPPYLLASSPTLARRLGLEGRRHANARARDAHCAADPVPGTLRLGVRTVRVEVGRVCSSDGRALGHV